MRHLSCLKVLFFCKTYILSTFQPVHFSTRYQGTWRANPCRNFVLYLNLYEFCLTQFPFLCWRLSWKKLLFSRLSPLWHDMMTWSIKNAPTKAILAMEIVHSSITLKQGIYPIVKKRFAWQYIRITLFMSCGVYSVLLTQIYRIQEILSNSIFFSHSSDHSFRFGQKKHTMQQKKKNSMLRSTIQKTVPRVCVFLYVLILSYIPDY